MSLSPITSLQARTLMQRRLALIVSLIVLAAFALQHFHSHAAQTKHFHSDKLSVQPSKLVEPDTQTRVRLSEAYGKLPLSFEANRGQVGAPVKFLSRGVGYTLFLTPTEALFSLQKNAGEKAAGADERAAPPAGESRTLRWKLIGANSSPILEGINEFGGNFVQAEMVKAFIASSEYRQRFGN